MNIFNARLRGRDGLHRIELNGDRIAAIAPQQAPAEVSDGDLDAASNLVVPPFIEPHIHLDATLTAGEPNWNMSGTLFEGIERWAERKAMVTHEDTKTRAKKTIDMLVDHASSMYAPMSTSPTRRCRRSGPCSKCGKRPVI